MRRGLVAVGVLLIVLGSTVVALGVLNLPGTAVITAAPHSYTTGLAPGDAIVVPSEVPSGAQGTGTLNVSFHASDRIEVWAQTCPASGCPASVTPPACPTATSTCGTSGSIQLDITPSSNEYVFMLNLASGPVNLGWTITATFTKSTGLPAWECDVLFGAGGALAGIGAVASFLGLFLRGEVYARPAASPPPTARPTPAEEEAARTSERAGDEGRVGPPGA